MVYSEGDTLLAHPDGGIAWACQIPGVAIWHVRHGDLGLAKAPDHMELGVEGSSAPLWRAVGEWILDA